MKWLWEWFSSPTRSQSIPSVTSYRPDSGLLQPDQHLQRFQNSLETPLEVFVEPLSELYILQPGDEMTLIYTQHLDGFAVGLHTEVTSDGLLICPSGADFAEVLINGKPVVPVVH